VTDKPLVKDIYIEAPPEVVFAFLTDPAKMVRWMGLTAELDPKPGGIYRLDPNGREMIRGTYLEVIPNSKVVFTWGWEEPGARIPAGSTVVEITLKREGLGTRLRLVHRDLPDDRREQHDLGWAHYLSRLKTVSEGGKPGADPCADPNVQHG
jgi:uncharacterized protein YndB with AHSA1/START domain